LTDDYCAANDSYCDLSCGLCQAQIQASQDGFEASRCGDWFTINAATGVISGLALEPCSSVYQVIARNSAGVARVSFRITSVVAPLELRYGIIDHILFINGFSEARTVEPRSIPNQMLTAVEV
jgi:hypothetical protein